MRERGGDRRERERGGNVRERTHGTQRERRAKLRREARDFSV